MDYDRLPRFNSRDSASRLSNSYLATQVEFGLEPAAGIDARWSCVFPTAEGSGRPSTTRTAMKLILSIFQDYGLSCRRLRTRPRDCWCLRFVTRTPLSSWNQSEFIARFAKKSRTRNMRFL